MSLIDLIAALFGRRRPAPPVVPPPQPPPPPVVPPGPPPPQPPPTSDIPAQLLAAHNAIRAARGLPLYRADPRLQRDAQTHSDLQAQRWIMSHMGIGDGDPWQRILNSGYRYSSASENVAAGERDVPEVMAAWMDSPPHRANILGDYSDFGGAAATGGNGVTYWTCVFAEPA